MLRLRALFIMGDYWWWLPAKQTGQGVPPHTPWLVQAGGGVKWWRFVAGLLQHCTKSRASEVELDVCRSVGVGSKRVASYSVWIAGLLRHCATLQAVGVELWVRVEVTGAEGGLIEQHAGNLG